MEYAFGGSGFVLKIAATAINKEVLEDAKFMQMMADAGFTQAAGSVKKYTKEVANGEKKFIIQAEVQIGEVSGVLYSFIPVQLKDMPTFTQFPYGFTNSVDKFGKGKADIDIFEKANNGIYNDKRSMHQTDFKRWYHFYDNKNDDVLFGRAYFVSDDENIGLTETSQCYINRDLIFYEADGMLYVTKEFKALAKSEGFEYTGNYGISHYFENPAKTLRMVAWYSHYSGFISPVLDVHFVRLRVQGTSSNNNRLNLRDTFEPIQKTDFSQARVEK